MVFPLETFKRALDQGPTATKANSSPNQWAGRTTLSSGSATVTVSTFQVTSDAVIWRGVEAALPAAFTTFGRTSVISGEGTAIASTTAVYSGMQVVLTPQVNAAVQSGNSFRVQSMVDGVSFNVTYTNGTSAGPDVVVNWSIPEAVPDAIKVNTISHGNYFTLGWADGRPRPVDVTLMWELRKTS